MRNVRGFHRTCDEYQNLMNWLTLQMAIFLDMTYIHHFFLCQVEKHAANVWPENKKIHKIMSYYNFLRTEPLKAFF